MVHFKLFQLIGPHLEHLSEFVRHRLAYFEATGDLPPGEQTPDEVVDEVLLRAQREFNGTPDEQWVRARLIELARETIAGTVKRSKAWRRRTSARIETDIPDTHLRQRLVESGCRFKSDAA